MASIARAAGLVASRIIGRTAQTQPWILRSGMTGPAAGRPAKRAFSMTPAFHEKKYTQDHEWIELSPDGKTGTIGITKYAASSLGDVVYVELPTTDLAVSAGDAIGAVESVKSASDIMTPVSGTVVEANSVLEEKPGTINKGPEAEGWIAKIEVGDKSEIEGLMSEQDYKAFTEE